MVELGQLEKQFAEFEKRGVRIVVSSIEGPPEAQQTQTDFPHLIVLSDSERSLANVAEVIHAHSSPKGDDTSAPTTVLIDSEGRVRWLFRPDRHIERISVPDLLAAIDQNLLKYVGLP
jgi:peroxiredoxin